MSGNTIQNVVKVSTVENKKKLFKCFTCDSKFSNPKDLLKHITLDQQGLETTAKTIYQSIKTEGFGKIIV